MQKCRNIGAKTNYTIRLIETFGIGMLIIDEIQNLDFSQNKENSFESLLTIVNATKIAMTVIGTEDAYAKMFKNLRTRRRVGTVITANDYCSNINFFKSIMIQLFKYQWFDERIELTDEIINTFHEETIGIIDLVVGLYIAVQYEYLNQKPKKIDSKFIKEVSNKYYPSIKKLLKDINDPTVQKSIQEIINNTDNDLKTKIEKESQNEQMNKIATNIVDIDLTAITKHIIDYVATITDDYSPEHINEVINKTVGGKKLQNIDEKELTRKVYKQLLNEGKDKRRKPKISTNDMLNQILKKDA